MPLNKPDPDEIRRRNARVFQMRDLGCTCQEIGRELHISSSLASRILNRGDEQRSKRGAPNGRSRHRGAPKLIPADPLTCDVEYTTEQSAWLAACEAYQRWHDRLFLNKCDYLQVAKSLGYRLEVTD